MNEGVIIFPDSVLPVVKVANPNFASVVQGGEGSLKIRTTEPAKMATYNLRGALVKAAELPAGETTILGIRPGVYVVKLSTGVAGTARVK